MSACAAVPSAVPPTALIGSEPESPSMAASSAAARHAVGFRTRSAGSIVSRRSANALVDPIVAQQLAPCAHPAAMIVSHSPLLQTIEPSTKEAAANDRRLPVDEEFTARFGEATQLPGHVQQQQQQQRSKSWSTALTIGLGSSIGVTALAGARLTGYGYGYGNDNYGSDYGFDSVFSMGMGVRNETASGSGYESSTWPLVDAATSMGGFLDIRLLEACAALSFWHLAPSADRQANLLLVLLVAAIAAAAAAAVTLTPQSSSSSSSRSSSSSSSSAERLSVDPWWRHLVLRLSLPGMAWWWTTKRTSSGGAAAAAAAAAAAVRADTSSAESCVAADQSAHTETPGRMLLLSPSLPSATSSLSSPRVHYATSGITATCSMAAPDAAAVVAVPAAAPPAAPASALPAIADSGAVTSVDLSSLVLRLNPSHDDGLGAWEMIIDKTSSTVEYKAWRRDPKDGGPTEYRTLTRFLQCSARLVRDFYTDCTHLQQWDPVVKRYEEMTPTTAIAAANDVNSSSGAAGLTASAAAASAAAAAAGLAPLGSGVRIGRFERKYPLCSPREYVLAWKVWGGRGRVRGGSDGALPNDTSPCLGETFFCVTKSVDDPRVTRKSKPKRVESYSSGWRVTDVLLPSGLPACDISMLVRDDCGMQRDMAKMAFRRAAWGYIRSTDGHLRKYGEVHGERYRAMEQQQDRLQQEQDQQQPDQQQQQWCGEEHSDLHLVPRRRQLSASPSSLPRLSAPCLPPPSSIPSSLAFAAGGEALFQAHGPSNSNRNTMHQQWQQQQHQAGTGPGQSTSPSPAAPAASAAVPLSRTRNNVLRQRLLVLLGVRRGIWGPVATAAAAAAVGLGFGGAVLAAQGGAAGAASRILMACTLRSLMIGSATHRGTAGGVAGSDVSSDGAAAAAAAAAGGRVGLARSKG